MNVATVNAKSVCNESRYQEVVITSDPIGEIGNATTKIQYNFATKTATKPPEKHKNRDLFAS